MPDTGPGYAVVMNPDTVVFDFVKGEVRFPRILTPVAPQPAERPSVLTNVKPAT